MDRNWNDTSIVLDNTVSCLLCKAVISFDKKDKAKYTKHMQYDHGAFYNINLLLVINILDRDMVFQLIEAIKNPTKKKELLTNKQKVDSEAQTDDFLLYDKLQILLDEVKSAINPDITGLSGDAEESSFETQTSLQLNEISEAVGEIDDIKEEHFIPPDPTLQPVEISLEDADNDDENILFDHSNQSSNNVSNEQSLTVNENINKLIPSQDSDLGLKENQRKVQEFLSQTEYFKEKTKIMSNVSVDFASKFTEIDPTLPDGWRMRIYDRKNGRRDFEYLSPELKKIRSRVGVVNYMKAMGGYSDEEIYRVLPAGVKIKTEKR